MDIIIPAIITPIEIITNDLEIHFIQIPKFIKEKNLKGTKLEQWMKEKNHTSAVVGIVLSVLCLVIFGKDSL